MWVRTISKYAPNDSIPPCQSKAPNDIEKERQGPWKRYTMQTNINPESNDQARQSESTNAPNLTIRSTVILRWIDGDWGVWRRAGTPEDEPRIAKWRHVSSALEVARWAPADSRIDMSGVPPTRRAATSFIIWKTRYRGSTEVAIELQRSRKGGGSRRSHTLRFQPPTMQLQRRG